MDAKDAFSMDRDLNMGDVASLLNCSERTIRSLVRQGHLAAKRQRSRKGRGHLKFRREDVEAYRRSRDDAHQEEHDE